jgi:7,8-dihydro-6-hydroxymethylpterin dimethyltransferase
VSTQTLSPAEQPCPVIDNEEQLPQYPEKMRAGFKFTQPEKTLSGSPILPLQKGLPKTTQSLCPECTEVIEARLFEEDGKVWMEKTCAEHGYFRDLYYSDVKLYLKMEQWHFGDGVGLTNPSVPDATRCPSQCGLCSLHQSHTALANIDLTNRCNLTCPSCFANANTAGSLYEPSFAEIRIMLQALRNERPVAGRVVQFSGGEPTTYPRFTDVLRMAKEMGFSHIQAATNGIMLADLEFAQRCAEAGLQTLYLQLDGVTDDVYKKTRGEALLEKKLACIENCKKTGMKIVFVPTIVKGINDHQVGDIVRLALQNIKVMSGISFQPVAFTGRLNRNELAEKRFTQADLAHAVSDQTGLTDKFHDWFPLACVTPFSRLTSALRGEEVPSITCHPHCSLGTYLFVDEKTGNAVPITRFFDVGNALQDMYENATHAQGAGIIGKSWAGIKAWSSLKRHFHQENAPDGLHFDRFLDTLRGFTDKKIGRHGNDGVITYRTLLVAGMHFMDSYNYDVERVKRCVIHYAAPNGLLYPFCAYNSGPCYREKIEKKYSIPFEKQLDVMQIGPANS